MLLELNVSDFAIIERLNLRFGQGFNVLTGETGAGKSIIIDALGTLRGERADPTFVRSGAERARIEGVFSIAEHPELIPLLDSYGLWDADDDQVILTREINRESGRSVARVNGRAVNSATLREIGGQLVDIHGQHEGLALFNTRTHADMLDRYGGLIEQRDLLAASIARVRKVREELQSLRKAAASRAERIEELRILLEDVQAAKLRIGEEEELLRERVLVQNHARVIELVTSAYATLYAGDESARRPVRPIIEALGVVVSALDDLARLDPALAQAAEQSHELLYAAEDLAEAVRGYRETIDSDPGRLDAIEDRLTLIRDMQRKYRAPVDQIVERAASAEAEIERLTHSAEHLADLEQQEQQLLGEAARLADQLSQHRRRVGDALALAIVGAMGDLAMPYVRFHVSIERAADPQGLPIAGQRWAFDKHGIDQIEFLLAPNPGEPLKPLAKIASGGESARLLLALKSILSNVDEVPTLIFDEVDVGVGGRAGTVVGEKLWSISDHHQVICITHLPQVAAFGDRHYAISKMVVSDRTRTVVTQLGSEQRIDEIAAMLDGVPVSEHSRRSAQEMLERSQSYKRRSHAALSPSAVA